MAQHYTTLEGVRLHNTWLTIGSFDGVHLGHQQLISSLNERAHQAGVKSIVLTFHPHPAVIVRGRKDAFYLTTASEKATLLDNLDVDIIVIHSFTYQTSQSPAREFVAYMREHLGFQQLWVGHDFTLGKGREGNVDFLTKLGGELGYSVHVIEPVTADGKVISSSQIRNLLLGGMIEEANALLGRPYTVSGVVIHGDGRGKRIGIPTANLATGNEKLIPGAGVYACKALVKGEVFPAAINIGTRPTFESHDQKSTVEAHILGYTQELYGDQIALEFIHRLRGEERFGSVEDLINQIHDDIEKTREIFEQVG